VVWSLGATIRCHFAIMNLVSDGGADSGVHGTRRATALHRSSGFVADDGPTLRRGSQVCRYEAAILDIVNCVPPPGDDAT